MSRVIISTSKLLRAIEETLNKSVGEVFGSVGSLKEGKTLANKKNRLTFSLTDWEMGLSSDTPEASFFSYKGTGTLFFDYSQGFETAGSLAYEERISHTTPKGHKVDISIKPQVTYTPTQERELGGYHIDIPFTFFATIKEQLDVIGTIEHFEFTVEQEAN